MTPAARLAAALAPFALAGCVNPYAYPYPPPAAAPGPYSGYPGPYGNPAYSTPGNGTPPGGQLLPPTPPLSAPGTPYGQMPDQNADQPPVIFQPTPPEPTQTSGPDTSPLTLSPSGADPAPTLPDTPSPAQQVPPDPTPPPPPPGPTKGTDIPLMGFRPMRGQTAPATP